MRTFRSAAIVVSAAAFAATHAAVVRQGTDLVATRTTSAAVVCLEDDSTDASTSGSPDPDDPLFGEAFFYLYRGTPGPLAGPGSFGRSSGGGERHPASGGCPG